MCFVMETHSATQAVWCPYDPSPYLVARIEGSVTNLQVWSSYVIVGTYEGRFCIVLIVGELWMTGYFWVLVVFLVYSSFGVS